MRSAMKHRCRLTAVLLLLGALLPGCLPGRTLQITGPQLDEYLRASGRDPDRRLDVESLDLVKRQILEHTLLAKAWESLGIPLDERQLDLLKQRHEEIAVRVIQRRRARIAEVRDDEIRDFFELARLTYYGSHILVHGRPLADSLSLELKRGADFASLARARSEDPGSAEAGGSLGPLRTGQTVLEFEDALLALETGEISEPVHSPYGWHLIRLDSLERGEEHWTPERARELRRQLERKARRRDALRQRDEITLAHEVWIDPEAAKASPVDTQRVLAASRDTSITAARLHYQLERNFGKRAASLGDDLLRDFVEFWILQDCWLRECAAEGLFTDGEVLDRLDIHERMAKSALFVNERLSGSIEAGERDLWNYLANFPHEFLEYRHFGLWRLEFRREQEAREALHQIREGSLVPEEAASRWAPGTNPFELSPAELRELDHAERKAVFELDPGRWTEVVENGLKGSRRRWRLWYLVRRRMPDMDESTELAGALRERVEQAFLEAEVARVVEEMRKITRLRRVRLVE